MSNIPKTCSDYFLAISENFEHFPFFPFVSKKNWGGHYVGCGSVAMFHALSVQPPSNCWSTKFQFQIQTIQQQVFNNLYLAGLNTFIYWDLICY